MKKSIKNGNALTSTTYIVNIFKDAKLLCEHILHYSHVGSLIYSLLFNGILSLCLYSEKKYQLLLYRHVLYIQCCSDMMVGVLHFVTSFRFVMIDEKFFVVLVFQNFEISLFSYLEERYLQTTLYYTVICTQFAWGLFIPLNFYFRYQHLCSKDYIITCKVILIISATNHFPKSLFCTTFLLSS